MTEVEKKKKKKTVEIYGDWKPLSELIKLEKVPTGNPDMLAKLMVMAYSWGQGDALAGMMLNKIIVRNHAEIPKFYEAIVGKKMHGFMHASGSPMMFLDMLDALSKKYVCFKYVERGRHLGDKKTFEEAKREIEAKMVPEVA